MESRLPELSRFRDTVLDNASIADGDVVLDVGTGTGLIGFGALQRLGVRGRVIFSDISADLVDQCRECAAALGALDRCDFLLGSADDPAGLSDGSVDVVTTNSVLIYLDDEQAAFHELFRVLTPGGACQSSSRSTASGSRDQTTSTADSMSRRSRSWRGNSGTRSCRRRSIRW